MSADPPTHKEGEVRLDPESIEALARRLAELLGARESLPAKAELVTAEEVARRWGVSRRWVYDHAEELGARRLGGGRRPRLRFDPEDAAERLGAAGGPFAGAGSGRRSAPMRADCTPDSLSARGGAMLGRPRKRPGRRVNAPRPGAG